MGAMDVRPRGTKLVGNSIRDFVIGNAATVRSIGNARIRHLWVEFPLLLPSRGIDGDDHIFWGANLKHVADFKRGIFSAVCVLRSGVRQFASMEIPDPRQFGCIACV